MDEINHHNNRNEVFQRMGAWVVFFIKSKNGPLQFFLSGLLHLLRSFHRELMQLREHVLRDSMTFAVPPNSERSGLTYFLADLLQVLPDGTDRNCILAQLETPPTFQSNGACDISAVTKKNVCRPKQTRTHRKEIKQEKG